MSDSETDSYPGDDAPTTPTSPTSPTPGAVSENPDLLTAQSPIFSSSLSVTSMDGSLGSGSSSRSGSENGSVIGSVNGSAISEQDLRRVFPTFERMARSRSMSTSRTSTRPSETALPALRTVPATTNLRPQDDLGRRSSSHHWNSMSRSVSPSSTPSTSSSLSPRRLTTFPRRTFWTDGNMMDYQAHHLTRQVCQLIMQMQQRLPEGTRRRRNRRHRRSHAQVQAQAQAQGRGGRSRLGGGFYSEGDDYSDLETAQQMPRCTFAQVPRRGNSVSDCSQCSGDEEQEVAYKAKHPIPEDLAEWLYPA
ncbi:hypothetical protein KR009_000790 [Drosophila setifemur]|nr:hypothetical protein KR009_000790 [Drosophila setifemur]